VAQRLLLGVISGFLVLGAASCQGDDDAGIGGAGTAGHGAGAAGKGQGGTSAGGGAGGRAGTGTATGGAGGASPTGGSAGSMAGSGAGAGRGGGAGAGSGGTSGSSSGASGAGGASGRGGSSAGRGTTGGEGGNDTASGGAPAGGTSGGSDYDATVLADGPVMYLAMSELSGTEPDLTGNGHQGTYHGGATTSATLPNGDRAADFAGNPQYVSVPSSAALSIPTTKNLTWEAWIRPDVLEFDDNSSGYVDWMGKCEEYSPTCEWEARMYNMTNSSNRCNRLSAYAFNPTADLGSGAYWEAGTCGTIKAGSWYHVVGEYTTEETPSGCDDSYPGSVDIWVNGVKWNQASHGDTGCMSQYQVTPEANDSALNIGTMAKDAWFQGAIAKVAIYDVRLSNETVRSHYQAMTGKAPTGSCASTCSF